MIQYLFLSANLTFFLNVNNSRFLVAVVTAALATREPLAKDKIIVYTCGYTR